MKEQHTLLQEIGVGRMKVFDRHLIESSFRNHIYLHINKIKTSLRQPIVLRDIFHI